MMNDLFALGISDFELTALCKLLLASVCGGVIGLERELRGRPAGLKTFSLVCVGAALVMITNDYIYTYVSPGEGDITRMAAQVISGIGFLGAGSIMVTGHKQVMGLTTAASLWVTAALGFAIGSGFYAGGLIGLAIVCISSVGFRYIDRFISERSRQIKIYVEGIDEEFMLRLEQYLSTHHIRVLSFQRQSENKWYDSDVCAMLELDQGKRKLHKTLLENIRNLEGFRYVEELD